MNLKEAIKYSNDLLKNNEIDEYDFKSVCICASLLNITNSQIYNYYDKEIDVNKLNRHLSDILNGRPLQYIIGKWDFYNSTFSVGEGVLIPRPETEELVDFVIKNCNYNQPVIYDLCSGSGCVGISLAREIKNSKVFCVEKSKEAFKYLKENSLNDKNVFALNEDIFGFVPTMDLDILVSNPPYIKSSEIDFLQSEVLNEPSMALDGGKDGLDFYRYISEHFYEYINVGGLIAFEIGNEQGELVKDILVDNKYSNVKVIKDIYGNDRIVKGVK